MTANTDATMVLVMTPDDRCIGFLLKRGAQFEAYDAELNSVGLFDAIATATAAVMEPRA
jgi:hypothetical protein